MRIYQVFLKGVPEYLARHYWWAYLWRPAIWFFDHQSIINLVLFGQYNKLMKATTKLLNHNPQGALLQLSCVYGSLTPVLLKEVLPNVLHITDVSWAQLRKTNKKVFNNKRLCATRMNAESLGYKNSAFSTIVIFFLLHEMPREARRRTLLESLRVLSKDGMLICTEYNHLPSKHFLYRFPISRIILTKLEPFLESFWNDNMLAMLNELGDPLGKRVEIVEKIEIFSGFYQVTKYKVSEIDRKINSDPID